MPLYLICYDIADDRRRYRVERLLKGRGLRAQRSVFECDLDPDALDDLQGRLEKWIDPDGDRIHIYRLCGKDAAGIATFGGAGRLETPDYRIL
jgi:CRISPR-associated protein Cas2